MPTTRSRTPTTHPEPRQPWELPDPCQNETQFGLVSCVRCTPVPRRASCQCPPSPAAIRHVLPSDGIVQPGSPARILVQPNLGVTGQRNSLPPGTHRGTV